MTGRPGEYRYSILSMIEPEGAVATTSRRSRRPKPNPCFPCSRGDHEHCQITECWRCPGEHRMHGVCGGVDVAHQKRSKRGRR
jgi:hypothetical protein